MKGAYSHPKHFGLVLMLCKVDSILISSNVKFIPVKRYLTLSEVTSCSLDLTTQLAQCPSGCGSLIQEKHRMFVG